MKNKLINWAAALRVFWGITAALALFSGIIIAYVSKNYLWIVYCAVGAIIQLRASCSPLTHCTPPCAIGFCGGCESGCICGG